MAGKMDELPFRVDSLQKGEDYESLAKSLDEMRPEIYAIEDEIRRMYMICLYHATKFSPNKSIYLKSYLQPKHRKFYEKLEEEMENCKNRDEEISKLPIEDTIWFIDHFVTLGPDENGESVRYLVMIDKKTLPVAMNIADPRETTFEQQSCELVRLCALYPLIYSKRRPLFVTFKNPVKSQSCRLNLSQMGVKFLYLGEPRDIDDRSFENIRMRECNFCHFRAVPELFHRCSSCQAVLYCSKQCQRKDWDITGNSVGYSHSKWCLKMKSYMDKINELQQLPFEFTKETTSAEFSVERFQDFLKRNGVYNEGLWKRECTLWLKPGQMLPFGKLPETDNPYVLPVESSLLEDSSELTSNTNLRDWESYYKWRGFRFDSPICVLMQFPLTLYHIIQNCLPTDYLSWWDTIDTNEINIDIVGVEKEVEMLEVFQETGKLLPRKLIDIHMFGREISSVVDGIVNEKANVKITIHKKAYHKSTEHRKPHLVVGFNAGLEAYRTWVETAKKLKNDKIPAYFTDYCQHSVELAKLGLMQHCAIQISDPVVNPFRSPIRKVCEEHDMPWFSNAFLFHFVFS